MDPDALANQFGQVELNQLNDGAKTSNIDESRQSRPIVPLHSTEFDVIATDDEEREVWNHR